MVSVSFSKGCFCETEVEFFVAIYIIRNIGSVNSFKSKTFTIKGTVTRYTHIPSRERLKAEQALYSKLTVLCITACISKI